MDEKAVWDRIKELDKEVYKDVVTDPYKHGDSRIKLLENEMKKVLDELKGLRETVDNLQSVEEKNQTLEKLNTEQVRRITELEQEKKKLETEVEGLKEDKQGLETKVEDLEEDKQGLETKVEGLEQEKKVLNTKVEDLETKVEGLEQEREALETKVEGLEQEREVLKTKVEGLEQEKDALNTKVTDLKNDMKKEKEEWKSATQQYKELMLLMYQCDSLEGLVQEFGMDISKNAEDFQSVVSFVSMLGNEVTFAPFLYQFWSEMENKKALDSNDYKFIDALNQYYKNLYGITYEVLYYPSKGDTRFDKGIMKDIISPNRPYQSFSEVYLPAVMRNGTDVQLMMKVKGV